MNITRRGNTYKIVVSNGIDPNGKQLRYFASFKYDPAKSEKQNKKEVELFALNFEKQVKEGSYLEGNNMTYKKLADLWLEKYCSKELSITTYEKNRQALNNAILPYFGNMKLSEIKPLHIQTWLDSIKDQGKKKAGFRVDYKPLTIKKFFGVLSASLTQAVYWQLIDQNPCKRIKAPRGDQEERQKSFTLDQARSFLNYIEEPYIVDLGGQGRKVYHERSMTYQYQVLFNLAIYGGFRIGEMLALTWKDIDFTTNTIKINKTMVYTKAKGYISKDPKTRSSIREVVVPQSVMNKLMNLKNQQKMISLRFNNLVFVQANGQPMSLSAPNHLLQETIKRYNQTHDDRLPMLYFHCLRHTCATLLIAENMDMKEVSSRLGHSTVSTTMDIYAHALKEKDEEASRVLDHILSLDA